MAYNGNPITHSFGVTAFGGGGGRGTLGQGAGSKRPFEGNDDSCQVIRKGAVQKHLQKRRILPKDSDDSDSDDSDIGQPTSGWSPTRGLVSIAPPTSTAGDTTVPAGSKGNEKQNTTGMKTEDQDDSTMGNITNQTGSREVVEISSDEEEDDEGDGEEQSDEENGNEASPSGEEDDEVEDQSGAGDGDNYSSQKHISKAFRKASKKALDRSLEELCQYIPKHCFARKKDKGNECRIWVASVRYVDQLGKVTYMQRVNAAKKDRTGAAQDALMTFIRSKIGYKFDKSSTGAFARSTHNLTHLLDGLKRYFTHQGRSVSIQGTSFTSNNTARAPQAMQKTTSRASRAQAASNVSAQWTPAVEGTFINELPTSGATQRGRPARTVQQSADGDQSNASHAVVSASRIAPAGPAVSTQAGPDLRGEQVSDAHDTQATSAAQSEGKTALIRRNNLAGSHVNRQAWQRVPTTGSGSTAVRDLLNRGNTMQPTSDAPIPAASEVSTTINTLKSEITAAMRKPVDWSNVPVALFETEMSLKRLFGALDRAKDAFAKSNGA